MNNRLIKRHINTTRYLLLDMRDRKGWKALGYESFKAYGEKELGYQEAHIYRLVEAAEVSLQIGYSPLGESSPKETHLRPLKSIPEEVRKEIWDEATRKAEEEHAKLTAKRTVEDIIEIGRELTAVKEKLPHGQFLPWIAAEFEMSRQTADNFTSVYERFGNGKLPNFSNFKPSILYALSTPSTPEAVIEKAVAKAESGENVTVADVKDWKAEAEAQRQLRYEAEQDKAIWMQRNKEWQEQNKECFYLKKVWGGLVQKQTTSNKTSTLFQASNNPFNLFAMVRIAA